MGLFRRIMDRGELMGSMFQRTGADVTGLDDNRAETVVRAAMCRCLACRSEDACRAFLEQAPEGAEPPAFCRNAELLRSLTPRKAD